MGVKGLTKFLESNAPMCMKEQKFESYFGHKIAIDASMCIYQFLIVVGRNGNEMLTNEAGEVTRYVFDGKPPDLKKQELAKRYSKRADATRDLAAAIETGDKDAIEQFSKRTVKVTKKHNEDCKKLLQLMGIPVVEAPSEAEAQCAALCKFGKACISCVYAVASEDMDSLTFGAPRFLRHLMVPSSRKVPVMEFEVAKILEELNLTMDQFIDLCILCGCDYCDSIRGDLSLTEGPPELPEAGLVAKRGGLYPGRPYSAVAVAEALVACCGGGAAQWLGEELRLFLRTLGATGSIGGQTALKLIRQHGSIENILENINKESVLFELIILEKAITLKVVAVIQSSTKYLRIGHIKKLNVFLVSADDEQPEIKWMAPNEEGLISFLVNENGFNHDRVTKACLWKANACLEFPNHSSVRCFLCKFVHTPGPGSLAASDQLCIWITRNRGHSPDVSASAHEAENPVEPSAHEAENPGEPSAHFYVYSLLYVKKPAIYQGEPALFFTPDELNISASPFRFTLVAKSVFGRPTIEALKVHIRESLHSKLAFSIGILDDRHMLNCFEAESDFLAVWLKDKCYITGKLVRFINGPHFFKLDLNQLWKEPNVEAEEEPLPKESSMVITNEKDADTLFIEEKRETSEEEKEVEKEEKSMNGESVVNQTNQVEDEFEEFGEKNKLEDNIESEDGGLFEEDSIGSQLEKETDISMEETLQLRKKNSKDED
ncbi:hypothetical protein HHK36_020984 [Tetracentron sinense]|uniref:Flap endonuclease 1 n=1 Tax=Tetracentron sinense TaxID=13715 RepID=A0A834YSQ0_TETSI|nr:hypothetical protein HHK36_020984 [Tetracentron sinense]